MMKTFWVGIFITIFYFMMLLAAIHVFNLTLMSSWNELGDFLSGAFSPVAFLWLVLGYLQQQRELKQNTQALELQASELKNSVDQYREMVQVARDQLSTDREIIEKDSQRLELQYKPDLDIIHANWRMKSGDSTHWEWQFENTGHEARNVTVEFKPDFGTWKKFSWKSMEKIIQLPKQELKKQELPQILIVSIVYESILVKEYKKIITLSLNEDLHYSIQTIT
ncbi:hypothetical protein [Rosenbergiella nectarea]|uniref:hypothetical protein n=2 Tax=Rosenbergiella nectarea TaxID=988801 RepID=UPI001F4FF765|nr:hypothetical protein [Rosenbergiella nectarea]